MSIEDVLGSKGRIKILKALVREGQLNITQIVKRTSMHHKQVEKHLKYLIDKGYVEEIRSGRTRIFSLKLNNPKTLLLVKIISTLLEEESIV